MNRFTRDAYLRALCAAVWCIPGALWWVAPVLGAAMPLRSPAYPDPRVTGGLICAQTSAAAGFHSALRWQMARRHPALVDSLVRIAEDPASSVWHRRTVREVLAATGQPRALRYLAHTEMPPPAPRGR